VTTTTDATCAAYGAGGVTARALSTRSPLDHAAAHVYDLPVNERVDVGDHDAETLDGVSQSGGDGGRALRHAQPRQVLLGGGLRGDMRDIAADGVAGGRGQRHRPVCTREVDARIVHAKADVRRRGGPATAATAATRFLLLALAGARLLCLPGLGLVGGRGDGLGQWEVPGLRQQGRLVPPQV